MSWIKWQCVTQADRDELKILLQGPDDPSPFETTLFSFVSTTLTIGRIRPETPAFPARDGHSDCICD